MLSPYQTQFAGWLGKQAAELAKRATVGPSYTKPRPAQTPAQGRATVSSEPNIGSQTGTGLVGGQVFKNKLNNNTGPSGVAVPSTNGIAS